MTLLFEQTCVGSNLSVIFSRHTIFIKYRGKFADKPINREEEGRWPQRLAPPWCAESEEVVGHPASDHGSLWSYTDSQSIGGTGVSPVH
jgi:hypothetical protein